MKKLSKRDTGETPDYEPFKIRQLLMDLDEYLRIFILPQIPAEYKEYREEIREAMNQAWRALYRAGFTMKRERQKRLIDLKVELAMAETYLKEVRDVCYRGKERKKLDKVSVRRFEICAGKQKAVMNMLWGWITNEDKKLDSSRTEKTVGLVEEEV
ncbi:hypothetical protein IKG05_00390 [Candidatus Saccharibacteria bacterium]|nr:hypothetical protein [Candidatus Saccharibacteria bacterium]